MKNQVFRHIKSGGLYVVTDDRAVWEPTLEPVVTYQSLETKKRFVRLRSVFEDGRFEAISKDEMLQISRTTGVLVPGWKYLFSYASRYNGKAQEVRVEVFDGTDEEALEELEIWNNNRDDEGFNAGYRTNRNGWKHYRQQRTL